MGFKTELTQDGSLTLRLTSGTGEAMHHSGGALDESLYIYGGPAREVFEFIKSPRIFSLGLGLGYNEWMIAALSKGRPFSMVTMESEEGLRTAFLDFLQGAPNEDLARVRNQVAEICGVDALLLHQSLVRADWTLLGVLGPDQAPEGRFHYIMYDAFSGPTSPELWEQEFLFSFLARHAEETCAFSTYASRGSLNRALDRAEFIRRDRAGFKGKRESTLAWRGK